MCFRILCQLVCLLNVQKVIVFLQNQVIRLRLSRCTVYLRWSIVSWKSRSPRFLRQGLLNRPSRLMVLLCCLFQSLMAEVCVFAWIIEL